eukprot:gene16501-18141_t
MEQHEYDRMKYNAFQVCEELTCRIDGAVAPGGFMKAYTSDSAEDLKQAEILFKEGKLDKEGDIATFSKKFIVEIDKVRKYVQHLTHLSIKKKKRAEQRVHIERQEKSKGFADYDWKNLFHKGMLAKLTVYTLDKYLAHFNLKNTLKLRKAEKVQAIQSHLIATMDTGHRDDEIEYMEVEPQEQAMQEQDSDKDMNSETSDEDIVIRDMNPSDSSSESTDEEADSFDASSIFTTLRSGRVAVNHRAANYVVKMFMILSGDVLDSDNELRNRLLLLRKSPDAATLEAVVSCNEFKELAHEIMDHKHKSCQYLGSNDSCPLVTKNNHEEATPCEDVFKTQRNYQCWKKNHDNHAQKLKEKLREYGSDPFDQCKPRSIVTGQELDDDVAKDMLRASDVGKALYLSFVDERPLD